MIKNMRVSLYNLVISLSEALDLVHPTLVDHQQRVVYVSVKIAQNIVFPFQDLADLMLAAVLHDIGVFPIQKWIKQASLQTVGDFPEHSIIGKFLLQDLDIFSNASELIKYHDTHWSGDNWADTDIKTKILANIIFLADYVDFLFKKDDDHLSQAKHIRKEISRVSGQRFSAEAVDSFLQISGNEAFWLNLGSSKPLSLLDNLVIWPTVFLSIDDIEAVGSIFGKLVDCRSTFTYTHSAGVTAVADELAKKMYFSESECRLVRLSGILHDLGKLSVPNSILDKPGKLDPKEFNVIRAHTYHTFRILDKIDGFEEIAKWAAFHHERLDGQGYPFHHGKAELPLVSRIMSVADVFTALTEDRPYRKAWGNEKALSVLHEMADDGALDNRIVELLADNSHEILEVQKTQQQASAKENMKITSIQC